MNKRYYLVVLLFLTVVSQSFQQNIDEDAKEEPQKRHCKLPAVPQHGTYMSDSCDMKQPSRCQGMSVKPFTLLTYSCLPGYCLPRNVSVYYSRCLHGSWVPVPPVCLDENVVSAIKNKLSSVKGDEPSNSLSSTGNPIPGGCLLPENPVNGRYFTFSCTSGTFKHPGCGNTPGTPVPSSWTITYTCNPGFTREITGTETVSVYSRCSNGDWDGKPPSCTKTCPPIEESSTLEYLCFYERDEVNCSKRALPGTVASYRCKENFIQDRESQDKVMSCTFDGEWINVPSDCSLACGISLLDTSNPKIIDGTTSPLGYFPWHAGVYHRVDGEEGWNQFCGGTLIFPDIIITAAYCVMQEKQDRTVETMRPSDVRVALGKVYRKWNKNEPTEVKRRVVDIYVPGEYTGTSTNFAYDIALLKLSDDVPISKYVMTVCMNSVLYRLNLPIPSNNMLGYITGWGNSEMVEPNPTTLYCSWPFQDYRTCFQNLVKKDGYIPEDKFCAGVEVHAAARKSVGGGFTFVANNKHYLFGILSSLVIRREEVDYLKDLSYPVFTNVTDAKIMSLINSGLYELKGVIP